MIESTGVAGVVRSRQGGVPLGLLGGVSVGLLLAVPRHCTRPARSAP